MPTMNIPVRPGQLAPFVDPGSVVINPAAIPRTELFIGDYDLGHTIFMDLIYTSSHKRANSRPRGPLGPAPRHPACRSR